MREVELFSSFSFFQSRRCGELINRICWVFLFLFTLPENEKKLLFLTSHYTYLWSMQKITVIILGMLSQK